MIFAYIADIHLSKYGQDKLEDETNLPERLHSIKKTLEEVAMYCMQNGIQNLVIGGDTLHGKSVIYTIAQEIMLEFFQVYGHAILFYVLDGNHDLSGKGEDVVSALRSLENVQGVHWIKFDRTYHLHPEDILFVPYSYKLPEIIRENRAKILISHFGLNEGILNSGLSIISDVALKDLIGRYELVLLGHYHKPQEIIRSDIRLYYVGSTIQLDWGEKNDEKRFLVVNSDTLDVQSIPFQNYRKHIEIELTTENKDEVIKTAQFQKDSGNHVKIIMKEKVDLSDIQPDLNIIDKTEHDATDRGISSSMSQEDILKRYMEIKEIPEEERIEYLNAVKSVLENVEI